LGFDPPPTIHVNTAYNYLKVLGYEFSRTKKGIYIDGHERDDIVAYRVVFLDRMLELEKLMPVFDGENMEIEIWPELSPGENFIYLLYMINIYFLRMMGEQPLRKKGKERSLHVSEFLTDICGHLKLDASSPNYLKKACVIITLDTNGDSWWTAEDLIAQVRDKVIPIFKEQFPGAVAVFAFNNATSHAAFAPDALVAKRMNKRSKGKQPKMRSTTFRSEITQDIVFPLNHPDALLRGQPKGLQVVLSERKLWREVSVGGNDYC
ncbi:17739_t:CDS:2, partial [Racocetra persica]